MDADVQIEQTWSRRDRATGAIVIAVLAVMIGIPVARFGSGDLSRFGWQMFSHGGSSPATYVVIPTAGDPYEVDRRDHVAVIRGDLFVAERLPAHLCARVVDAEAIEVTIDDDVEVHPC